MAEYEKCYVFQPDEGRSAKRRRTEPQGLQASWKLRKKSYQEAWNSVQNRIDEKLDQVNLAPITEIATFLDEVVEAPRSGKIPTGLILGGPNSALRTRIASKVARHADERTRRIFVPITSNSASNLKGALKSIIQQATSRIVEDDDEDIEGPSSSRKGPKLLNYDLQALYDHIQERHIQQVIITIEDTEAFDSDLLSEIIELLGCWEDRIPFAFLFNIATSVEFLQLRLSKGATKCLNGRLFDVAQSTDEVEQVFETIVNSASTLWLGPDLASAILDRQRDYIQSIDSLVQAVHYAYMSCYYANALSIFLDPSIEFERVPKDHFEAVRHLKSFRAFATELLSQRDAETDTLRELLDSDRELFAFAKEAIRGGRQLISEAVAATELVRMLQTCLPNTTVSSKLSLYVQAMSGKLAASPTVRSLLLSLRKAPSNITLQIVETILTLDTSSRLTRNASEILTKLNNLIRGQKDKAQPLRSEDDVKNSTLRTTVIAQKVGLSKEKSTLSKQDAEYTALLRQLSTILEAHLNTSLVNPKSLPLHEIFVYDMKSPLREVFAPRPRHALERALAVPHDYLDCPCCAPEKGEAEEATLAASQPATAVLYQLYLESAGLINAHDLWQAFQAVVTGEQEDEQQTMALFQRGLAELRYLGFVKGTRKRVDHIAKVLWKGL